MMTTAQAATIAPEVYEAFELAEVTPELSRWGTSLQARDGDKLVRVTEDDGAYHVIVLSNDRAELIYSEMHVSGAMANPATLAALIELGLDS